MLQVWSRRLLGLALALFAFVMVSPRAAQAQSGKIAGVVTDQSSGQPLEGVQVYLQGTGYGTVTSANGRYFLLSVPPGTYTVVAKRIGYALTNTSNVRVQIDATRELNFQLSAATTTLTTVNVVAQAAPLITPGQTGTTRSIDAAEIAALPVTSVEGALSLQQGFVQAPNSTDLISYAESRRNPVNPISIRGGRGGETLQLIDGIPVNNFIFGGPAFALAKSAVEQLELVKGGMEPQYGNALSGIINIATKEGGQDLAGSLQYSTSRVGDALGNAPDALRGQNIVEGFVSGPVPGTGSKLTFMFSGREERKADAVLDFDQSIFVPSQITTTEGFANGFPNARDVFPGFRAFGYNNARQVFGKLSYRFTPTMKLALTLLDNENQRQPFDEQFVAANGNVLNSPAAQTSADSAVFIGGVISTRVNILDFQRLVQSSIDASQQLIAGKFDHTLGRTHYDVIFGSFRTRRNTCNYFNGVCLGNQFGDANFTDDFFAAPLAGTCAIHPTCGTDLFSGGEKLRTNVVRSDVQSQVTDHHNLQTGFLYQGYNFNNSTDLNVGTNSVSIASQSYSNKPYDFALYLQDKIEYDFLSIKLGARYDYGAVPGTFFANPLDPTNGTTAADVCNNPSDPRWANGVTYRGFDENGARKDTIVHPNAAWAPATAGGPNRCNTPADLKAATEIAAFDDFAKAKARKQFSPRIGVAFPLTQSSSVFFNFGRYSQNPLLNNLLTNTGIGTVNEGTVRGPCIRTKENISCGLIGNPNLQTESATQYELGYLDEFEANYSIALTLFNKNQTGLTGVRSGGQYLGPYGYVQVYDPGATYANSTRPSYSTLVNQDFQSVRGFEAQLRRRITNYWGFDINYSYSKLRANSSDPEREYERQASQSDPQSYAEIPGDLDQPHSFNAQITGKVGEQRPNIRFGGLLRNTTLSAVLRAASGLPYSPTQDRVSSVSSRLARNSGRGPSTMSLDMLAQKGFRLANLDYDAFVQVANLLDRKNCIQVYTTTGTCDAGAVDQSRLRQAGTPDVTTTTFFNRADYYGERRTILGGVKVNF